jgi:hypothetical protein
MVYMRKWEHGQKSPVARGAVAALAQIQANEPLLGWPRSKRRARIRGLFGVLLASMLLVPLVALALPATTVQADPASLDLSGWGWCVAYREIGNVVLRLEGSIIPRVDATDVADIYLTGTLQFNMGDRTDSIALELRGTKVRSLFFLKQVSGGDQPVIAEFEGTWLGETNYVACEGRVALPAPNHVAKPYILVLRTKDTEIASRESGAWIADLEFIIQKGTMAFDTLADRIAASGEPIRDLLGSVATQIAVIAREIRALGIPYIT